MTVEVGFSSRKGKSKCKVAMYCYPQNVLTEGAAVLIYKVWRELSLLCGHDTLCCKTSASHYTENENSYRQIGIVSI